MGAACTTAFVPKVSEKSKEVKITTQVNDESEEVTPFSWANGKNGQDKRISAKTGEILQNLQAKRKSSQFAFDDLFLDTERRKSAAVLEETKSRRRSSTLWNRTIAQSLSEHKSVLNGILRREENEDDDSYLKRLFSHLDVKKCGKVFKADFVGHVESENVDAGEIFLAADRDNDGYLTFDDFHSFFCSAFSNKRVSILAESDLDDVSSSSSAGLTDGRLSSVFSTPKDLVGRGSFAPLSKRLRDISIKPMGCQAKRIKCVDVSATGNLMAVAHRDDCSVHIYSTTSGAEVVSLRGHGDSLLAVKFSPNPKFIATASRDSLLVIWDRTVGLEYQFVEHPGIVTAISFSFDGKHIYSGCQDDTLRKITSPKANLVVENDDFEAPEDAELSIIVSIATQHTRDRYVLFSRSCNKCAYLADAETLNVAATLKGHNSLVLNTGFNADDTCFFTACDSKIILWNYSLAQLFCFDSRTVSPDPSIKMCWTTVAFGPMMKESLLYAFASSGQLLVYDIRTFKPIMDLYFRSDIRTVSQSSYQGKSVCGDDLGNVYVIKTM